MTDRRQQPRVRSMFVSAYIRTGNGLQFVTLRNISEAGLCFDAYPGVTEGDEIEFCVDAGGLHCGTVRWVKDGRCGVSSDRHGLTDRSALPFPPRSVRLPLTAPADLFVRGQRSQVTLSNLSMRGACVSGDLALAPGQLVSLRIGDCFLEMAAVRWSKPGLSGIRFAAPIRLGRFRELVASLQESTRPLEFARVAQSCGG